MSKDKILVIEDNPMFAKMVNHDLSKEGYEVTVVGSGGDMFQAVDKQAYDCLILDLGLPDEDGIVLLRKMRARSDVQPIIVLTGREGIDDKLTSFELGADDYINKPVDPRELVQRLKAILRRSEKSELARRNIIHLDAFVLDHDRREAYDKDGTLINLTPAEFSLFWILASAGGKVLSRDTLVDAISTGEGPLSPRAIDILISRVRKKIDKDAILTIPRTGYKCGWDVSRS